MAAGHHILVVDDDRRIRELIKTFLMDNAFRVTLAATAAEARHHMESLEFDLMILDVMMPGEDGLTLAASLRHDRKSVPILMLSALADPGDRIKGLETGSDDYLGKPFEPQELLLRTRNLIKRRTTDEAGPAEVSFGQFVFHLKRGELRGAAGFVKLTSREKEILRRLAQSGGEPVSREELAPAGQEANARGVDVQVNRLRQKLEMDPANPIYLQTIRGAGYVLHVEEG